VPLEPLSVCEQGAPGHNRNESLWLLLRNQPLESTGADLSGGYDSSQTGRGQWWPRPGAGMEWRLVEGFKWILETQLVRPGSGKSE
jgi:hypothetical protein